LNDGGPISSLAAASLFVVVIAGGGNSFERRKDLVSIKEKRAYLNFKFLALDFELTGRNGKTLGLTRRGQRSYEKG
jgi:hypothetical protein